MTYRLTFANLMGLACAATLAVPVIAPKVHFAARVESGGFFAPDTLVMQASWTNPVDDGRGAIDSMRVRFVEIQADTSYLFRAPFPTGQARRQVIPATAYAGATGQATYPVFVQVTTYRRSANALPVNSTTVSIVLNDVAPPNVTGILFTAVKRP